MTKTDITTILEHLAHNTEIKHQIRTYMTQGFSEVISRIEQVELKHADKA